MQKNYYICTILLFYVIVYLLPLGARPLLVPDETRYAEIPREMVATGDWVTPQLNGLKYYEKPIMGYWAHALSQKGLGESNFAVRFPGAVSTGLVAFLVFLLLATVMGRNDSRAYLAPLILLSSFGIFGIGTTAILDNVLNFFLTASIVLFFLASEKQRRSLAEKFLLVLAGIAIGCAFLTKGFLAFVVPVVTAVPYLVWQKRAKDIVPMFLLPAAAAVVISLPWSIMIHLRDADFWHFFFWNEHVKRFFSDNAQHQEPVWFYFFAVIPLFLPWILLLPSFCSGLFIKNNHDRRLSRIISLSVCWLVFPFLFFSISSGKLITYLLPCLPPLAILAAIGLLGSVTRQNRLVQCGLFLYMLLGSVLLAGLIGSQLLAFNVISLPEKIWHYDVESLRYSQDLWKPVLISSSLAIMIVLSWMAFRSGNGEKKLVLTALSPLVVMVSSFYALPDLTLAVKDPGLLYQKMAKNIPDDAIVLSGGATVSAACWYLKRNDVYLLLGGGELDYGLAKPEGQHRVLRSYESILRIIDTRQDKTVVLLLQTKNWQRYFKEKLPPPSDFVSTGPHGYVLARY